MKNKKLYRKYATMPRSALELWLDVHNHKLELVRTIGSMMGVILQCVILLKVFGKI